MFNVEPIERQQLRDVDTHVNFIRRQVGELEALGWEAKETAQPLRDYDAMRKQFEQIETEIDNLPAVKTKQHEAELTKLLEKQSYYIEALFALANKAAGALQAEEIAFFENRETLLEPFIQAENLADRYVKNAFADLVQGLQNRYAAMLKHKELGNKLADITRRLEAHLSSTYGGGEVRLSKPFDTRPVRTWRELAGFTMARLSEVLFNSENGDPADIAESAYRK